MCILSVADKTKQTYINMFQHLVQSCSQSLSGVHLDISVLHLDFEIAVHEGSAFNLSNVLIKACQFHLGQACVYTIKLVIKLWTVLKYPISKQMNVRLTQKLLKTL
jgi:hypothetical protein